MSMESEPGVSVIPGVWAGRLERLGLVELLAGVPDLTHHQRVRWLIPGFERLEQLHDMAATAGTDEGWTLVRIGPCTHPQPETRYPAVRACGCRTVHITEEREL